MRLGRLLCIGLFAEAKASHDRIAYEKTTGRPPARGARLLRLEFSLRGEPKLHVASLGTTALCPDIVGASTDMVASL
jgi:hypothetical protein